MFSNNFVGQNNSYTFGLRVTSDRKRQIVARVRFFVDENLRSISTQRREYERTATKKLPV